MSTIDQNLLFSSDWDIDQLVISNILSVTTGLNSVYILSSTLPTIPVFEVQFQPTGSISWYQAGSYSTDGTLANINSFYTYVDTGTVYINVPTNGIVRYFVWSDKVDY